MKSANPSSTGSGGGPVGGLPGPAAAPGPREAPAGPAPVSVCASLIPDDPAEPSVDTAAGFGPSAASPVSVDRLASPHPAITGGGAAVQPRQTRRESVRIAMGRGVAGVQARR